MRRKMYRDVSCMCRVGVCLKQVCNIELIDLNQAPHPKVLWCQLTGGFQLCSLPLRLTNSIHCGHDELPLLVNKQSLLSPQKKLLC